MRLDHLGMFRARNSVGFKGKFILRKLSSESGGYDRAARIRIAKFAAIGGPSFILFGVSSLIVHSPDNRARIEPYAPKFGI